MDTRLAWFTGVMEAEGSITAQVYTLPDGRVRITPFICIVNSDEGILAECAAMLDLLSNKAPSRRCGHVGTNKPCHTIRLDGPGCEPVLRAMLPYMRSEKKRNAERLLDYIESREKRLLIRDKLGRVVRAPYSRHEVALISSMRTHKMAKSFEAICEAPNVS